MSPSDLVTALDGLSDADLRRWFELSARSMHLQLHSTEPVPRMKGGPIGDELSEMASALSSEERESLLKTMDDGTAATPERGCSAFLQLMRVGVQLPETRRDAFIRGFNFASLVDW